MSSHICFDEISLPSDDHWDSRLFIMFSSCSFSMFLFAKDRSIDLLSFCLS